LLASIGWTRAVVIVISLIFTVIVLVFVAQFFASASSHDNLTATATAIPSETAH
jgi:uncharacterized membrane protein